MEEQLTFANKQIVAQFGLNKGFSQKNFRADSAGTASDLIDMDTIPDLLGDGMDLDKDEKTVRSAKAILGALSVVAGNTKLSDSLISGDAEKAVAAFANDLADGKADGLDEKGESSDSG